MINNFKDLKIWQKGMDLTKNVYITTSKFPINFISDKGFKMIYENIK